MKCRILVGVILLLLSTYPAAAQDIIKLDSLQLSLKSAKEDTLKTKILLEISLLYYNHNYIRAVEFAQQGREFAVKSKSKKFEAKADRALGNLFTAIGDYKNASKHYFSGLKFYEAEKDTLGVVSMHNNLGVVYDRLREFDKALIHYFKARDLYNQLRPLQQQAFGLPSLYNNIANIYQTKGDYKSALQYYNKALTLAIETNNRSVQGVAYNNLGKLYFLDIKQQDTALMYLNKGLKVREEEGNKAEIAKSLVILSNFYNKKGATDEAKSTALRAIELGEEIGSLEILQNGYLCLSEVEEALGRNKESLTAYRYYKNFSDSIKDQQASGEITRLQLQYDFEKADKLREEESRQSRTRYVITIVALSVGLVVAILLTVLIRTRARQTELKRKNLAQDVEIKNKELTTNVMYLIRKNELINSVAERLLKLQSTVPSESHKIIHDIIIELQKEADNDSWKEFELRFHQVHSEFYTNLRKQYPALSPADEKLCAFLRLNMSSKEIAAITQQSIKSVEVARARLRKKLNLTNTSSNLVTHLANL
jgi:tetratricopeptide (TPR) repeat protein